MKSQEIAARAVDARSCPPPCAGLSIMQISAPFCFACGRHIERSFVPAKLLAAHSVCLWRGEGNVENLPHFHRRLPVS